MNATPQQSPALAGTILLQTGTLPVAGKAVTETFLIGNTDKDLAPTLDLTNAAVVLETIRAAPPPGGGAAPGEWGKVDVTGVALVDATVGQFTPKAGAGTAATYQPGFLTVALAEDAALSGIFDLRNGGVAIKGDASSALEDFGLIVRGTDVNFHVTGLSPDLFPVTASSSLDAPVTGDSVIFLAAGQPDSEGRLFGGQMSFRQGAGEDVTVFVEAGSVGVHKPAEFHATVDLFEYAGVVAADVGDPDAGPVALPPVAQNLFLRDLQATSWGFDDATHTMTLYDGVQAVSQVRFADHITADDFFDGLSQGPVDAQFVVAAYDNGVDIASFYESDVNQLLPMLEPGII